MTRPFVLALFSGLLLACSGSTISGPAVPGGSTRYSKDAESNYKLGMARMEDSLFQEAIKYFTFVKDRFPYSKYAALSDLRIADAHFLAREYTEAIDQYKRFIRLHPSHDEVPYATFKIGVGYYKQLPADWFLVPPSYEKDLTAVEEALKALEGYRKAYPDHKNNAEADELIAKCKRKLADHELYVARFYEKREKWNAVIGRLEVMRQSYLGVGLDREIYAGLTNAYYQIGEQEKACSVLEQFKAVAPKDPEISQLSLKLKGCTTTSAVTP